MDLLRLEVGPSFAYVPNPLVLRRHEVRGPSGPIYVYYRRGQRRFDPATDGELCFTPEETGQVYPNNAAPIGVAHEVGQDVLDKRTVVVKPWWLYADYRSPQPTDRVGGDWARRFPGFALAPGLLVEPDGATPTTEIRVCREEAQAMETGAVWVSGRPPFKKGDPLPAGRGTPPPNDSGFARAHRGQAVSCLAGTGFQNSLECGCGVGLERCVPAAGFQNEPPAFVLPTHTPLGAELPFEATPEHALPLLSLRLAQCLAPWNGKAVQRIARAGDCDILLCARVDAASIEELATWARVHRVARIAVYSERPESLAEALTARNVDAACYGLQVAMRLGQVGGIA